VPGFESYRAEVAEALRRTGFATHDGAEGLLEAHRRALKLTRFGFADTFVVLSHRAEASPDDLRVLGEGAFERALERKVRLPRGLGSSIVLYPVLAVDRAAEDLRRFASEHAPTRWGAIEFPVVVDLGAGALFMRETTRVWGAAYERTTREEARRLFEPGR
jgi:hypothetical protein